MRNIRAVVATITLIIGGSCARAAASDLGSDSAAGCNTESLFSIVERGTSGTSPCTLRSHTYELETGYYQNASSVGGTQLAAYPLSVVRYALTPSFEAFVDPTTRIAKNGLNGKGIYTWSRSGAGLKIRLSDRGFTAVALRLNYTPQADETATISTRNRFDTSLIARSALSSRLALSATVGMQNFTQAPNIATNRTSSWYERLAISNQFAHRTQAIFALASQSSIMNGAGAQSRYGLALRQTLAQHAMLDVQIGSCTNAAGNSKAHYLEAGFSLYPAWQRER